MKPDCKEEQSWPGFIFSLSLLSYPQRGMAPLPSRTREAMKETSVGTPEGHMAGSSAERALVNIRDQEAAAAAPFLETQFPKDPTTPLSRHPTGPPGKTPPNP